MAARILSILSSNERDVGWPGLIEYAFTDKTRFQLTHAGTLEEGIRLLTDDSGYDTVIFGSHGHARDGGYKRLLDHARPSQRLFLITGDLNLKPEDWDFRGKRVRFIPKETFIQDIPKWQNEISPLPGAAEHGK